MPSLYLTKDKVFDFDDIMLVPKECVIKSRSEANTSLALNGFTFETPIVPSNMSTILNEDTAIWLATNKHFYIMHRFDVNNANFITRMKTLGLPASISVGVQEADYAEVNHLAENKLYPDFVTIDIAHGDSKGVRDMITHIAVNLPTAYIIAGNVATAESAARLAHAGAHAIKVGVAPGSACLTGPNTGFGSRGWQLSAVADVAETITKISTLIGREIAIIADGGIRHPGDIAKALAFGADMVMVGGMLSGHDENPGEIIPGDDGLMKEFFGSASAEQKGERKHVEGKRMLVPYRGSLGDTMAELKQHLQSSISYSGGTSIADLRNVSYVRI